MSRFRPFASSRTRVYVVRRRRPFRKLLGVLCVLAALIWILIFAIGLGSVAMETGSLPESWSLIRSGLDELVSAARIQIADWIDQLAACCA